MDHAVTTADAVAAPDAPVVVHVANPRKPICVRFVMMLGKSNVIDVGPLSVSDAPMPTAADVTDEPGTVVHEPVGLDLYSRRAVALPDSPTPFESAVVPITHVMVTTARPMARSGRFVGVHSSVDVLLVPLAHVSAALHPWSVGVKVLDTTDLHDDVNVICGIVSDDLEYPCLAYREFILRGIDGSSCAQE